MKEIIKRMTKLLEICEEEISNYLDGEECDHETGICWCGQINLLNDIHDIIKEVKCLNL